MDAKSVLVSGEETGHCVAQRQRIPVGREDYQIMRRAQIPRHDVHQADLSAMAVQQQQFADAGARHAGTKLHPHAHQSLRGQGQCSGETDMFVALSHLLGRQEQHRKFGRQMGQRGLQHAVDQCAVHAQRQMRSMLLGSRHGQHGDCLIDCAAGSELRKMPRR